MSSWFCISFPSLTFSRDHVILLTPRADEAHTPAARGLTAPIVRKLAYLIVDLSLF
jgi:hypothetical protein